MAGIIDALSRYAQGYASVPPPRIRFCGLPDIFEMLRKFSFARRRPDSFWARKKRTLVARLLPRVAMLPISRIHWLEGNEVRSIDRSAVEREIGGLSVETLSDRICIRIHPAIIRAGLLRTSTLIDRINANKRATFRH